MAAFCFWCASFNAVRLRSATLTEDTDQAERSKLTNDDITQMKAAGLSTEVIVEKIGSSLCEFDTSPRALADLKMAGVSEPVILAMLRYKASFQPKTDPGNALQGLAPPPCRSFGILPVASDKVLNVVGRHIPYDEILALIQRKLADALKGRAAELPGGGGAGARIELIQALGGVDGLHLRADLVLRMTIAGTDFSKIFQGDASRKKLAGSAEGWSRAVDQRLDEAANKLVKSIVEDQQLIKLLTTQI